MITFCQKSVHPFLRFANSKNVNGTVKPPCRYRDIPTPVDIGLSFIAKTREIQRPTNVVESSTILKSSSSSSTITTTTTTTAAAASADIMIKKDAGGIGIGIGFIDDVGGEVNGLMSCTESLGFESSDERRTDEQIQEMNINQDSELCPKEGQKWKRGKKAAVKTEVKKFPPPLSSLNKNGQPNFFFRAVRKDGRLELTEVRIDRPEILRASRQDGRLTLHLIQTAEEEEEEEEEEEIEEEEEKEEEKIKEEERSGEWMFPLSNGGGDGFRRCHELVSHHHHHNRLQVWSQQCVTST